MFQRAILALALLAGALGQTPGAARPAATYRIAGTVVHALTGDPLPHTELAILSVNQYQVVKRTFADAAGRFEFTGIAPGKYSLEARRPGFFRQGLNQHENFWTGIAVGPGLSSENIVFRLRPDASISGTVADNQNEEVQEAQVLLFADGLQDGRRTTSLVQQVNTDDVGHYHFRHLPPGSYYIAVEGRPWYANRQANMTVTENGEQWERVTLGIAQEDASRLDMVFPITFYPGVTDSAASTPLVLKAGDQANADVVLTAVPSIHVRVKQPAGTAKGQLPGMTFSQQLFGTFTAAVPVASSSTRDGEVELSGLPPGQFTFTMQSFGGNARTWTQNVSLYGDSEIEPTGANSPVNITGVITRGGQPVTSQPVVVLSGQNGAARARASADGKFEISQYLKPGTYEIAVYNVPESLVSSVSANGARILGRSLEIAGPGPISLAVEMSRGVGQIQGTALQGDKPAPGVMILLVPRDQEHNPSLIRRDQSDSDGTFTLRSIAPGTYTLLALANGWEIEWANPAVLQPYLQRGQALEIAAGKKEQVRVNVQ